MTKQVEHTPTPWSWVLGPAWGYTALVGPNNQEVLIPGGRNEGDSPEVWMGEEMSGDDTQFIITACNNHDKLMVALSGALTMIDEMLLGGLTEAGLKWHIEVYLTQARTTLVKAKEG